MIEIGVLSVRLERLNDLYYDAPEGKEAVARKFRVLICEILKLRELLEEKTFTDRFRRKKSIDRINNKFMKLVYDVENSVEFYVMQQDVTVPLVRILPQRYSGAGRNLTDDILIFRKRTADLKHQFLVSRVLHEENVDDDEGVNSSIIESLNKPEIDINYYDEEAILEDEKSTLVSMLLDGTSPIAITGPDGVPTTTLAKRVFNDAHVQSEFEGFAWVWVGHRFRERHVLLTILYSLGIPLVELLSMKDVPKLKHVLRHKLKQTKCLIVLDDIWKDAWYFINDQLPDEHGCRVIITTQLHEVTNDFTGKVYQSRTTTMESFELFKLHSEIILDDDPDNLQRKETVKNILSHCQNFPLAIVEVAKFLKKESKLERWKDMGEFKQEVGTIPDSRILNAVRSRYDLLPSYLKSFFLYLGQFSPGHLIPVEKLYLMMKADGLIPKDQNILKGIEVIESFLQELAIRSLVIMVGDDRLSHTRGQNACQVQVHNLIHYLCTEIGKDEEFFQVIDYKNKIRRSPLYDSYSNTIRLVVHLNGMDSYSYIPRKDFIRSLIFFGKEVISSRKSKWREEVLDLKDFPWIRALDFNGVDFRAHKLPKNIDQLHYLRYLGFRDCYIPNLNFSLSNFINLETLDLRTSDKVIIPNELCKLVNLMYLYFPVSYQSGDENKLKLEGLMKLQVIENFHAGVCDVDDLSEKDVKRFSGIADGNTKDFKAIVSAIDDNRNLRDPSLTLVNFDCYTDERQDALIDVLKCDALLHLNLEGHLKEMPRYIGHNFISMVFDGSEFENDPLPILGALPYLRSLVLCNDAIEEEVIIFPGSSFGQLKNLKLGNLRYLEKLIVDANALPNLSILTIEQCHKLENLPDELMGRESITELKIGSNPNLFKVLSNMRDVEHAKMTITHYDC